MSVAWSIFVALLAFVTMGVSFFLFIWAQRIKIPTHSDGTTNHVWAHGVLREGVRRLPRWWVLASAAAFAFGFGYLVLFGELGGMAGVFGFQSSAHYARAEARAADQGQDLQARLRSAPMAALVADREVVHHGRRLFKDNCGACHGLDARGVQAMGAPDLLDSDWLYGGDEQTVMASILDGRTGLMPPMGEGLTAAQVTNLAHYVISLSRPAVDPVKAELGRSSFRACAACHGPAGKGNPLLGAPDLTDSVWLYGGSARDIASTITSGRSGLMPAWRHRLGEDNARAIAAWLYASGSGAPAPKAP